jgi:hypothetical protein
MLDGLVQAALLVQIIPEIALRERVLSDVHSSACVQSVSLSCQNAACTWAPAISRTMTNPATMPSTGPRFFHEAVKSKTIHASMMAMPMIGR